MMPTFIDESGNTGVYGAGGTAYFRLAAVRVPEHDVAAGFRGCIRELRMTLGLKSDYEFKFADTHVPEHRTAFFGAALRFPFRFAVSQIDKRDPYWNCGNGPEQHWACATELAAMLRDEYRDAERNSVTRFKESITVDDNQDRSFLTIIKRQFRGLKSKSYPENSLIGKVKFRKSAPDEMLQLVDMVCGASGAFLDSGRNEWYRLIAERNLQPFPHPIIR